MSERKIGMCSDLNTRNNTLVECFKNFKVVNMEDLIYEEKQGCQKGLDRLGESKGVKLTEDDVDILKGDNKIYIIPKIYKPFSVVFEDDNLDKIVDQIASIDDVKMEDKKEYVIDGCSNILEKMLESTKELQSMELVDKYFTDNKPNHKKKNKQVKSWERTKFYQR